MSTKFLSAQNVSQPLEVALSELTPANPFCTRSYAAAMRACGHQPWLLGVTQDGTLVAGCRGFIIAGRLNRVLQISSLPATPLDDVFWAGLRRFCSQHRITSLELNSFASSQVRIPPLAGEVARQERCEYVIDLRSPEWEKKIHRKHWQNIQRAAEAGVTLRRGEGVEACREHMRLMQATMERRRQRGESVPALAGTAPSTRRIGSRPRGD